MEGLIMAAQIILSLSILVGLHELGHLVAAKVFNMRVEKYSIGFPPKIFGVKYGETEYSIGAVPLGGYVKICGMIDESLDTEAMNQPPKDYEFRAKPAWQRLIVMMGGIIVNVITGVIIFIFLTFFEGEDYLRSEEVNQYGIEALELGQEIGLQTGDKIIRINGEEYDDFEDIKSADVLLGDNSYYTVLRGDEELDIFIPGDLIERLSEKNAQGSFVIPLLPFTVGEVEPGSKADEMGLQPGDKITAINDQPTPFFQDFNRIKTAHAGEPVTISVSRAGQSLDLTTTLDSTAVFGFISEFGLTYSHKDYSFGQSIGVGTTKAFSAIWVNARALGKVFTGDINPSKSLMGPIRIATEVFGGTWDWVRFWSITGLLSMVLAFMNFLPIPALDGGHVMFLTYEIVSGRKPSDKFLEVSQKIGMFLLLGLMGYVILNDIFRAFL